MKRFRAFRNKTSSPSAWNNLFTQKFGRLKEQWVAYMQAKEARLTWKQKQRYWLLFCLLAGGGSMAILLHTVLAPYSTANHITIPAGYAPILVPPISERGFSSADSLLLREQLRHLDSLQQFHDGRRQLDSLFAQRPGLKDTIAQLKNYLLDF